MCRSSDTVSKFVVPNQTPLTLERWHTVQTRCRRVIRQYHQAHRTHQKQHNHSTPITKYSNQLTLDDYKGYEGIAAFGNCPGPISIDETQRLIGGSVYGVSPFDVNDKLGGAAVKLRHLKAGSHSLIDTNVEYHRYYYDDKTITTFKTEFGATRVKVRKSSEICKTTHMTGRYTR
jgi:hypothetical protein